MYTLHFVKFSSVNVHGKELLASFGGACCINGEAKSAPSLNGASVFSINERDFLHLMNDALGIKLSLGWNIVVCQELYDLLGDKHIAAIIAHEEGHVVNGDRGSAFRGKKEALAIEIRADDYAANKVGAQNVIDSYKEMAKHSQTVFGDFLGYSNMEQRCLTSIKPRLDNLKKKIKPNNKLPIVCAVIAVAALLLGARALYKSK